MRFLSNDYLRICYFALVALASLGNCRTTAAELPEDWATLELSDFLDVAVPAMNGGSLDAAQAAEVANRAKGLLLNESVTSAEAVENLQNLFNLAKEVLNGDELAELQSQLLAREDDISNMVFPELQLQVEVMEQMDLPPVSIRQKICQWCDGERSLIEESEQSQENSVDLFRDRLGWALWRLRPETVCGRDFSVVWTGSVIAPHTGEYKFSICPVNSSYENNADGQYLRQSMSVAIGDQMVVDAKWDDWQSEGRPVTLEAGAATPIEVRYEHVRWYPDEPVKGTVPTNGMTNPVAMLYWSGPSIDKSLVPSDQLVPPNGEGNGLKATYHSTKDGDVTIERVELRIDHNWVAGHALLDLHEPQVRELISQAWEHFMNLDVSQAWLEERPRWLLFDLQWVLECMSHEQRLELIDWALANAELVNHRPWWSIEQFYVNLRHDEPDKALDVLGSWLVEHADLAPELGEDFFVTNRMSYPYLSDTIFHQYPANAESLREKYLSTDDGRCVLPAAYLLAHGYVSQGKIEAWIEILNERLNDKNLTGDRRVNWLIARAMADELRYQPVGRNDFTRPRLWGDDPYLVEAALVADSPEVQERVLKERVVRKIANQQWDDAEQLLQTTPATLSSWSQRIADLKEREIKIAEQRKQESQAAYLAELQRRRQVANDQGDTAAAARYSESIEQLESIPE